ncbi:MAG: PIN domain protein [Methanobacterium sp. PtaB.Bin024]|jgi:predicted nucleic acid-binding protein|nr:MAG: PIN domain protein [Methanobacterium sp. PtaB.Bin024]
MKGYLIDTNILIYYMADDLPKKEISHIEDIIKNSFNISIITKIEFLGWDKHTKEGYRSALKFLSFSNVIPLENHVANLAIKIRRESHVRLPDAVIAASSLHHELILVTRNQKDFKGISGLEIYNPFQ